MVYASQDSLIKRYGEDTLRALARTAAGEIDTPKVTESLEDASQTIDSYLAGRYTLPLNSNPPVLERHCCYIARYFLERNRATDQARKDYEDSLRFLEKVAAGTITLGIDEDGASIEGDNFAQIESANSVWPRDKSKGFI